MLNEHSTTHHMLHVPSPFPRHMLHVLYFLEIILFQLKNLYSRDIILSQLNSLCGHACFLIFAEDESYSVSISVMLIQLASLWNYPFDDLIMS
jgi:hypothetical protein